MIGFYPNDVMTLSVRSSPAKPFIDRAAFDASSLRPQKRAPPFGGTLDGGWWRSRTIRDAATRDAGVVEDSFKLFADLLFRKPGVHNG